MLEGTAPTVGMKSLMHAMYSTESHQAKFRKLPSSHSSSGLNTSPLGLSPPSICLAPPSSSILARFASRFAAREDPSRSQNASTTAL